MDKRNAWQRYACAALSALSTRDHDTAPTQDAEDAGLAADAAISEDEKRFGPFDRYPYDEKAEMTEELVEKRAIVSSVETLLEAWETSIKKGELSKKNSLSPYQRAERAERERVIALLRGALGGAT